MGGTARVQGHGDRDRGTAAHYPTRRRRSREGVSGLTRRPTPRSQHGSNHKLRGPEGDASGPVWSEPHGATESPQPGAGQSVPDRSVYVMGPSVWS